jgi:competence protein ComEC
MLMGIIAFLTGIIALTLFSPLPSVNIIIFLLLSTSFAYLLCIRRNKFIIQFLLIAVLGFSWAWLHAYWILQWNLPPSLENKPIIITGYIASLPKITDQEQQFIFTMQSFNQQSQSTKLRLSWFKQNLSPVHVGDRWQLQVRLKRPHAEVNPGTFSYEEWLFVQQIRATGYVINSPQNRLLQSNWYYHTLDRIREYLQLKIQHALAGQDTAGLIIALIVGSQNAITAQQWQVMQATGTNHLMAIAGVHIGFVSGFIYLVINFIWRRSKRLPLILPAPQAAAIAALLAAFFYSALAGFALPTQRALVMLTVFMLGVLLRRQLALFNAFIIAVWLVLLWNPLAILTISFWLSFGTVFAILYGISGRLHPTGWWWHWGRVQWVITIALIPFAIWLFQQVSLVSFLANSVAVPAVGFLVLPLCALGVILLLICQPLGTWILWLAAKITGFIWDFLSMLAHAKLAVWQQALPNMLIFMLAIIGILLFLAPKGLPGRWLGICWLLPLLFYKPASPKEGEMWFTLLDVGQGLSAVIQTQHHTLVYDTGPKAGDFDAGQSIVLPYLRYAGITKLDTLVVSHGDNDHIGGAPAILQGLPTSVVLTSVPQRLQHAQLCLAGQHWLWDGVTFTMLYPSIDLLNLDNNSSCVLKITAGKTSILLTGDIEKSAEDYLVTHAATLLPATILVAPHHGSKTSSSLNFIDLINPQYVLFPIGYLNRYHFPNNSVIKRYQTIHAQLLNTANSGAIVMHISAKAGVVKILQARQTLKKIWFDK